MKLSKPIVLSAIISLFAFTVQAQQPASLPQQALTHRPVCPPGQAAEFVRCHAHVIVDSNGKPQTTTNPVAYGPAQFHSGYNLPTNTASQQIIAIVDAYDHPNIKSDLDVYSTTFGIPTLPTCTTPVVSSSVACFQKIDQRGGASFPATDSGWALEISLDVEVAHAICQNCSILLVEADSNSFANLLTAFDQAVAQGAKIISNSYGSSKEFSGETIYDSHFTKNGIAITFSSGDNGYGTIYPAASKYVTAVGGTTLKLDGSGNYASESAWSGAGSGCSLYETKPTFQKDTGCSRRTIADVSADADPNTGAAIYDSVPYNGSSGWFRVGGTSLSSPLIASVYALAGGVASSIAGNSVPYAQFNYSANLHDITAGSNGRCRPAYLCTAVSGYDGPTGLGTPNGLGAF